MDETPPPPAHSAPQATVQQPPPEQSQSHQNPQPSPSASSSPSLPSSSLPLSSSSSSFPLSPNPNPTPPSTSQQTPQSRSPFNRQWPPQQSASPFPQYPSQIPSMLPSSSSPSTPPMPPFSSAAPSSVSTPPPPQRSGGMAIGVPAHRPGTPSPPTSFSSLNPPPFGQQFGGLARGPSNVPESVTSPSTSQVRQPIQGIQGIGSIGSFSSGQQARPSGLALHQHQHQQRPSQSSARPQTTQNNQPSTSQSFQGHSLLRAPTAGSPLSPSPGPPQNVNPHNQPWLSSASQGKPPLPPPTFRPPVNSMTVQQRSHISQQHPQSMTTTTQQPQASSPQQQQQPVSSLSSMEHYGQQFSHSRVAQSLPSQQQTQRTPGLGNQKPSHTVQQTSTVPSGLPNRTTPNAETGETSSRILTKRTIQELVAQIDPSEKLDPEVEDILMDIADDYVETITTFGCSLAKHRKSTTLEAKDILLHLERNWHMTLPGFSGDEIKNFRKASTSDIHRERLAAVRRSMTSSDGANVKTSVGQVGNTKVHQSKTPLSVVGSPNPKIREAA